MYRDIEFEKVGKTLLRLRDRIEERFPQSGLLGVCDELLVIASETKANLTALAKPNYWIRASVGTVISIAVILIYYSFTIYEFKNEHVSFFEVVQIVESAVNDVILGGLAVFFLVSLESKYKRKKALESLNELRAISHIVDMHQLTKDPTEMGSTKKRTKSSPKRYLDAYGLRRYLDYCSEMLAIVGKIAALYAQCMPDATVISSVNEIETLTSGISRKAWQKIMILQQAKHSN